MFLGSFLFGVFNKFLNVFPNRGSPLRVLMGNQRGDTEKQYTKRDLNFIPTPPRLRLLSCFRSSFLKLCMVFGWGKNCNGKTKGLALLSLNRLINGFSFHFPNRGSPLRVFMVESKRRYTETIHKVWPMAPPRSRLLSRFRSSFLKLCTYCFWLGKKCNGKTKGLALQILNRLINGSSIHFSF